MITSQRALKGAISFAIAAGLTVSLSGCFGNPFENLANGLVEGTVEKVVEGTTGVDVDVDGTGGSLPDSWPSEVPVPDGKILFSLAAAGTYSATLTVDSQDKAKAGYEQFVANGYEVVSEISLGDQGYAYGLQSDNWTVQYSWGADDEGTATVNVTASPVEE
ncbi:hypothetical protein [Salinibacterium sp. PAMC 21357]|uniref:hypothetical protein n=1 Tax=Salinibacterium sp. PAMC 21357 TaxID=1112215 RepID=UPI000288C432|nr:hypothetical protein [Salinibacterium sp. PAMC 21357]